MLQFPAMMRQFPATPLLPTTTLLPVMAVPQEEEMLLSMAESELEKKLNDISKANINLVIIGKASTESCKEEMEQDGEDEEGEHVDESDAEDFEQETGQELDKKDLVKDQKTKRKEMRRVERTQSSPEAAIGIRVEDIWEGLEPQLTPSEKLNSCFNELEISLFPSTPLSQVIEIPSNSSLRETIEILSTHKILSAPVRDVAAPDDASWMERYIGVVEFAGVSMWLLYQLDLSAQKTDSLSLGVTNNCEHTSINGSFFEALTSSEFYKNTTVRDISGSFRWAPFLAVQTSDTFLTMLLLLSKHSIRSLPVVDFGEEKLVNIITQSAVVHMLAECAGLDWFDNWGNKSLAEVGIPSIHPDKLFKVREDEPVLKAFQLMQKNKIGGLPVVDASGNRAIGNISIRDVQYLLTAPELYKDYRTITAKDFLMAIRSYLAKHKPDSPLLKGVITCKKTDSLKDVILTLDSNNIHRIYVTGENNFLEGVVTLRDIISKLVYEPPNYFGDFFDILM